MLALDSVEELDALPLGTVLRTNGRAEFLTVRVTAGWLVYHPGGVLGPVPAEQFWAGCQSAGASVEVISLPGGEWLAQEDYNYALGASAGIHAVTELFITKGAVQWAELGFKAPVYIEASEILDLFIKIGEQYDIPQWKEAIEGGDDN